ncbi:MAG: MFS transporter, partial [Rhodobacterales bacterium]|nr:MFS transporter [Rhodobacterales bacterium]
YLHHLGATRTEIGLVMSISGFGGLAIRPLVAWALDRTGRKPTLYAGTLVVVFSFFGIYFIDHIDWHIYALRIAMGAGLATLFTGYFTFASDLVPTSRRAEGLALFGIAGLIPMLVNPISNRLGIDPPALQWFLPMMGLVIAASVLFLLPIPESHAAHDRKPLPLSETLNALRDRSLWPVWWATIVFATLVAVFMAFVNVTAEARGLPDPTIAWLSYAVGAVMVRAVGATLPERIGLSRVLGPALLSYIIAMGVVSVAQDTPGFILAGALAGFGHGYCFPVLAAQTASRTPDSLRGAAMSLYTALWDLVKLLIVPVLGVIADRFGDGPMLGGTAVVALFGLLIWAALEAKLSPRTEA